MTSRRRNRALGASLVALLMLGVHNSAGASVTQTGTDRPSQQDPSTGATSEGDTSEAIDLTEAVLDGRDQEGRIVGASDALSGIALTSPEYDDLRAKQLSTFDALVDAQERSDEASVLLRSLDEQMEALDGHIERGDVRLEKLRAELEAVGADIRVIMTQRYVSGSDGELYTDQSQPISERLTRMQTSTLAAEASDAARDSLISLTNAFTAASTRQNELEADADDTSARVENTAGALEVALTNIVERTDELEKLDGEIRLARSEAYVSGTDMTLVAFDAYWRASQALASTAPSCGLQWWGLAGVGRTESRHGQYTGGTPSIDGTVERPIRGIALDGTNATQAIGDTDGGAIDGDSSTDRAVGPMQFIPSTWVRFAADMTGDGVSDPQNIYDSALAAATYLCSYGGGLDSDGGLRPAYFGYNHSASYVELVLSRSRNYESIVGEVQTASR